MLTVKLFMDVHFEEVLLERDLKCHWLVILHFVFLQQKLTNVLVALSGKFAVYCMVIFMMH